MKLQNPFDRKKQHNEIPVSLFPASKLTRTSIDIGRATPVYTLDMMQGNRVKVSPSELTRFAALNRPVMNNFKVTLGAFFCPYVALDEFFTSPELREEAALSNTYDKVLRANDFFDPAYPDAKRVHPTKHKLSIMLGNKLTGSLLDHLGYFVGGRDSGSVKVFSRLYPSTFELTFDEYVQRHLYSPFQYMNSLRFLIDNSVNWENVQVGDSEAPNFVDITTKTNVGLGGYSGNPVLALPLDVVALKMSKARVNLGLVESGISVDKYFESLFGCDPDTHECDGFTAFRNEVSDIVRVIYRDLFGVDWADTSLTWKDAFGNVTKDDVLQAWMIPTRDAYFLEMEGSFEANSIRYLTYMRIYSDWFLNSYFNKLDDFRNAIGYAYLQANNSYFPSETLRSYFSHENNPYINVGNMRFFEPYLQRGSCLPVLWEKNYFTAAQCKIDQEMADFRVAGDGAADTPIGRTIREHYFNRAFQRFKDLVARMGLDYRDNNGAMYGKRISDETLRRSQVVGFREYQVSVGDIAQTSQSTESSKLGEYAGMAISASDHVGSFEWTADQNGVFMILAWVRPENTAIANCIDRSILKDDYYDYLIPSFGGKAYQDILMNEVWPDASNAPDEAFAKTEIYSEYMSMLNECSGSMRDMNNMWHTDRLLPDKPLSLLSQDTGVSPYDNKLNFLYITPYDDVKRIFMDTSLDEPLLAAFYFKGSVTRQLPEHIQTDF